MSENIEISVIIPTYNRSSSLEKTLIGLSKQNLDHLKYEILVIDDGSSDNTFETVNNFINRNPELQLTYIKHRKNMFKAAACNTGIKNAQGKIIAFTDDDIIPEPVWLRSHLNRHKSEKHYIAVSGLVLYPKEWENKSNWVRFANSNYQASKKQDFKNTGGLSPRRFAGGNSSVAREILINVGLFDENLRRGQDVELAYRLQQKGIPIIFEENALVFHYAEAILSIEKTIKSFRKYYEKDRLTILDKNPDFFNNYGHWYLEPINNKKDDFKKILTKRIVRVISKKKIQKKIISFLNNTDKYKWLYIRLLHQYVYACEAIDAIDESYR